MATPDTQTGSGRSGTGGDHSRRDVLQYGAGLAMVGGFGSPAAAASLIAAAETNRAKLAIYDGVATAPDAFAAQTRRLGIRTIAFDQDPVTLWYRDIAPVLASGQGTIIGMTHHSDFFVVAQLARSHWATVRFLAQHDTDESADPSHHILIDKSCSVRIAQSASNELAWPRTIAMQLCALPTAGPSRRASRAATSASNDASLVSWVIGPRMESRATV